MKIALLGDIALYGSNDISNLNYKDKFSEIIDILNNHDFVIANLESPFTEHNKTIGGKSAYLKSNPKNIEVLKYLNISHVCLANNHIYDYGEQGLYDTIQTLDNNKINWYGVNNKSLNLEWENNKIRLRGYCCYSTNAKGLKDTEPYINALNPKNIELGIKNDKNDGFLSVLSIHWGEEHVNYPNFDHVKIARKFAETNNIILHGTHPHMLQGFENFDNSYIAYSLGNFCFDDVPMNNKNKTLIHFDKTNNESCIWSIKINNNKIIEEKLYTFIIDKSKYKRDDNLLNKITSYSQALKLDESMYNKKREQLLKERLEKRKSERDIHWLIYRLNYNTYNMIKSSKENKLMYKKLVKEYINNQND